MKILFFCLKLYDSGLEIVPPFNSFEITFRYCMLDNF